MVKVEKGNKVKIDYEGKLEDGSVFDSSEKHGKPLEFTVGSGQVIPGFDNAVIGMEKDEEKEVSIESKDAYGEPNPELLKKFPRENLPKDQEPKPGMMLSVGTPDGKQIPAMIKEVTDTEVTIDLNHPLAGKTLKFKIKVVEISEGGEAAAEAPVEAAPEATEETAPAESTEEPAEETSEAPVEEATPAEPVKEEKPSE